MSARRITAIETVRVRRSFWRGVPARYRDTALESGPNFRHNTRYGVSTEFSALYFSGTLEQSQKEVAQKADDAGEAFAFIQFDISVENIVDLTDAAVQKHFSVSLEQIVKPKHLPDAYLATQRIARIVYANRLRGLLTPSAYDPTDRRFCNLVLYPGNLLRGSIRERE